MSEPITKDEIDAIRLRATGAPVCEDCDHGPAHTRRHDPSVCPKSVSASVDRTRLLAEVDRLRASLAVPLPEELAAIEARAEAATTPAQGEDPYYAARDSAADVPRLLAGIRAQAAALTSMACGHLPRDWHPQGDYCDACHTSDEAERLSRAVIEQGAVIRERDAEIARLSGKVTAAYAEVKAGLDREHDLRMSLGLVKTDADNVWRWQGDGYDHPRSLSCPVVMSAETLRGFVAKDAEIAALRAERDAVVAESEARRRVMQAAEDRAEAATRARDAAEAKICNLEADRAIEAARDSGPESWPHGA